jgi:hypothetical protein
MCVDAFSAFDPTAFVVLTCGEDDSEITAIRMGDEAEGALYVRLHHEAAGHTCRPSIRPLAPWGASPWRIERSKAKLTRELIEAKGREAVHLPPMAQPPAGDREPVAAT